MLEALDRGDEAAFLGLVDRFHTPLQRLAEVYLADRAAVQTAVERTWLDLLDSASRPETCSHSLHVWLFRRLAFHARALARQMGRTTDLAVLIGADLAPAEPAVGAARFLPNDHPEWPGHWSGPPADWSTLSPDVLHAAPVASLLQTAITALPPLQRLILTLRDVQGWATEEVGGVLPLTEAEQRRLLHQARSRLRQALEAHVKSVS